MAKILLLNEDNIVENWVEGDIAIVQSKWPNALASDVGEIGQRWDGAGFVDVPIVPFSPRIILTADFRGRFTDAEMDAIMSLAYVGTGDAIARRILLKLQTRTDIDLDLQAVIDGMSYWVANGIMTQDRANEILN